MTIHTPHRPTWRCQGCGDHWPCVTRKRELLAEADGGVAELGAYLTAHFVAAAADLVTAPAGELHRRFLGWLRVDTSRPAGRS